jgi:hypothetical protein
MSRLTLEQILLLNLEQKIPEEDAMVYCSREQAYEWLKENTGQDFGYDVEAWKQWFKENRRKNKKR